MSLRREPAKLSPRQRRDSRPRPPEASLTGSVCGSAGSGLACPDRVRRCLKVLYGSLRPPTGDWVLQRPSGAGRNRPVRGAGSRGHQERRRGPAQRPPQGAPPAVLLPLAVSHANISVPLATSRSPPQGILSYSSR